jgi:hypothetical protein
MEKLLKLKHLLRNKKTALLFSSPKIIFGEERQSNKIQLTENKQPKKGRTTKILCLKKILKKKARMNKKISNFATVNYRKKPKILQRSRHKQ